MVNCKLISLYVFLLVSVNGQPEELVPTAAPTAASLGSPSMDRYNGSPIATLAPVHFPALPIGVPLDQPDPPTTPTSQFNISLLRMSGSSRFDEVMRRAARRWEQVITGDLPDIPMSDDPDHDVFFGLFEGIASVNVPIDDLLIGYRITPIDGEGGVLGRAGPIRGRDTPGNTRITVGLMDFDESDFDRLSSEDLESIIVHEMGHVIGLGTFSEQCSSCIQFREFPAVGTTYTCPIAQQEFTRTVNSSETLRFENNGGPGSACGHWEDDLFSNPNWSDIMTAFFESGIDQLLTTVDLGALVDLGGYAGINFENADPIPGTSGPALPQALPRLRTTTSFKLSVANPKQKKGGTTTGLMETTNIEYLSHPAVTALASQTSKQEFLNSLDQTRTLNLATAERTKMLNDLLSASPFDASSRGLSSTGVWKVIYAPHMSFMSQFAGGSSFDVAYDMKGGESRNTITSHAQPVGFDWLPTSLILSTSGTYGMESDTVSRVDFDRAWVTSDGDEPISSYDLVPDSLSKSLIRVLGQAAFIPQFSVFPVLYWDDDLVVFDFELLGTRICAKKQ